MNHYHFLVRYATGSTRVVSAQAADAKTAEQLVSARIGRGEIVKVLP